ncbi:uncharacterized protein EI90DRAFT_3190007 [Cantharellus anzutake]|uniref:uncharacterized protein n=1 Tax=Cantharellus anzutake TaxID=1750568 RepID=UPI00190671A7|nr:uncharacterized protein EI90DRAFT_3190007 [Cantharellus anzutake]KAF8342631.1 hypothetical protein EI90DRAFT_3190007 [Cantharellus anzutake]
MSLRSTLRIPTLFYLMLLYNAAFLLSFVRAAASFTWSLSTPIQCANMTLTVNGGVPPYQLLVIPVGNVVPETRRILALNTSSNTLTFELKYPAKSQFLAVVSDSTTFASGGTGVPVTVAANDDASCLTNVRFSWDNNSQGHVSIIGIIPGGETFRLDAPNDNSFFNWTVNARAGTTVELIAGDSRGPGTGGSTTFLQIGDGPNSCINDLSPSSTAGSPAGGITATPSSSATTGGGVPATTSASQSAGPSTGGKKSNNTGGIVGGVIGGLVGLALIAALILFCRRRGAQEPEPSRVDLMYGEEPNGNDSQPPMIEPGFYQSEPFNVPDPSTGRPSTDFDFSNGRRVSTTTSSNAALPLGAAPPRDMSRRQSQQSMAQMTQVSDPVTNSNGGGSRPRTKDSKAHPPSSMRAVNIVQHTDAGALDATEPPPPVQEQIVELPPTYSEVRKTNKNTEEHQ